MEGLQNGILCPCKGWRAGSSWERTLRRRASIRLAWFVESSQILMRDKVNWRWSPFNDAAYGENISVISRSNKSSGYIKASFNSVNILNPRNDSSFNVFHSFYGVLLTPAYLYLSRQTLIWIDHTLAVTMNIIDGGSSNNCNSSIGSRSMIRRCLFDFCKPSYISLALSSIYVIFISNLTTLLSYYQSFILNKGN